jgi:hypothetical protein
MNIKTLSVIALATAAISGAAFAQDVDGAPSQKTHALRHYRSTYNQAPGYVAPRSHEGFEGGRDFDRSRIGDHDADFNPSGS